MCGRIWFESADLLVCHTQAVGIALSSHRLDVLERVFSTTEDAALLGWVLQIVIREGVIGGSSRSYKNEVRDHGNKSGIEYS